MSDETPSVRELRPLDAASLSACFRSCYGDTYPADVFYNVERLAATIESGQLRSVVAVTTAGRVIGHTGLTIRHPEALAIEAGNTVVDPDYRGHGLLGRLGAALTDLCSQAGYVGYLHYPTTAHEIMQKRSVSGSGVETGVMLAYIPAETDYRAAARTGGRLAATVVYQPMAGRTPPSRTLYLPARYQNLLTSLYSTLDLPRHFATAARSDIPKSQIRERFQPRRGLLHLHVLSLGSDLGGLVSQLRDQHQPQIVHIDLPLDAAGMDQEIDDLIDLGFCFCALLPEFAHTDVLRLQWLADNDPALRSPELVNSGARVLLNRINAGL